VIRPPAPEMVQLTGLYQRTHFTRVAFSHSLGHVGEPTPSPHYFMPSAVDGGGDRHRLLPAQIPIGKYNIPIKRCVFNAER
jgi:hypothetical protein